MDKLDVIFGCGRKADFPSLPVKAKSRSCAACRKPIWVCKSSLDKAHKKTRFYCQDCTPSAIISLGKSKPIVLHLPSVRDEIETQFIKDQLDVS